jgi:ABC-type branched-subunit amino acid transport system ATPase component
LRTSTYYYGAIHALQGVSFHVEKGEIVTLIGANGAGKSTILRTLSGILRPARGLGSSSTARRSRPCRPRRS